MRYVRRVHVKENTTGAGGGRGGGEVAAGVEVGEKRNRLDRCFLPWNVDNTTSHKSIRVIRGF